MKSSTQKQIVGAVRKRLDELWEGQPSPSTISAAQRELYERLSESLKGQVDEEALNSAFRSSAMLAIWTEAERSLRDKPDPTPEQLHSILEEIETLDFASMLRNTFKTVLRKLPRAPRGKRTTLDVRQRKQAISRVRELTERRGLGHKQAYQQVAQNYEVHWRTIQNLVNRSIGTVKQ